MKMKRNIFRKKKIVEKKFGKEKNSIFTVRFQGIFCWSFLICLEFFFEKDYNKCKFYKNVLLWHRHQRQVMM